jgi:hypothetical protein
MPHALHPRRVRPRLSELLLPIVAIVLAVVLPLVDRGALPDPIAIHWGFDGRPDGSAPFLVHVIAMVTITALLAIVPLVGAGSAPRPTARMLVGLSHALAMLMLLLNHFTLRANRGATDWREAAPLQPLALLGMLGVALLAGLLGQRLAAWRPDRPVPQRPVVPAPTIRAGEVLVWVGRQTLLLGQVAGPLLLVAGVVLAPFVPREVAVVLSPSLAAAGLLLWGLTSVRVSVGPAGLRAGFGPFGWPRLTVRLTDITAVTVEDVVPMVYGGWGYRIVPGVRAVVIRAGEGLRLGRRGRSDLVITIDDAAVAAGVLAAHRAIAGGSGSDPEDGH